MEVNRGREISVNSWSMTTNLAPQSCNRWVFIWPTSTDFIIPMPPGRWPTAVLCKKRSPLTNGTRARLIPMRLFWRPIPTCPYPLRDCNCGWKLMKGWRPIPITMSSNGSIKVRGGISSARIAQRVGRQSCKTIAKAIRRSDSTAIRHSGARITYRPIRMFPSSWWRKPTTLKTLRCRFRWADRIAEAQRGLMPIKVEKPNSTFFMEGSRQGLLPIRMKRRSIRLRISAAAGMLIFICGVRPMAPAMLESTI